MADDIAIKVSGVSKSFKLPHEKNDSLKTKLISLKDRKRGYEVQKVLKNISFEVKKGEFFGIVGRNGSGKSTLLKIISEIYTPDKGEVSISGKLTPFIELGVGFNPELSGRENVFLNGALLGFNRKEIEAMYTDIVEFAELERFMDQKLKNYSSGMQVRLAFSIAIQANSDILVLDEVLAVGDEAFQRKCFEYFEKLKSENKTVILVTHSMESVRKYCNRAMFIKDGKVVATGNPEQVADEYSLQNLESGNDHADQKSSPKDSAWIKARAISSPVIKNSEIFEISISYKNIDSRPVYIKVAVQHSGANIMITNAKIHHDLITNDTDEHRLEFALDLSGYNWGDCRVVALLVDAAEDVNIASYGYNNELVFKIPQTTKFAGIMKTTGTIKLVR